MYNLASLSKLTDYLNLSEIEEMELDKKKFLSIKIENQRFEKKYQVNQFISRDRFIIVKSMNEIQKNYMIEKLNLLSICFLNLLSSKVKIIFNHDQRIFLV